MFVTIVEKRISSEIKKMGDPCKDWYALLAIALPFKPSVGFEFQVNKQVSITLERVIYNPANLTFWAQVEPLLHPKPNAERVANEFVELGGWDRAVAKKDLEAAKDALRSEAVKKLQRVILRAQSAVAGGPVRLPFDPRGPGRKR